MDTISKLQAELEELEKRLKAISNAQSTLSHLIAIRDYFDKVQEYLEIIKDEYSSSSSSCTECNEKIADLQEQINTINNTITNLPSGGGDVDLGEIELSIQNLTNEIENIKNGSDANLMSLSTDISTLQTEIGYIQDQIDERTTEISAINTQIGDMQNTITNLSSTQNSMTSAHTSMNNSINSLGTRLSTAEANISTLTGGVDVSAIEERLNQLETDVHTVPFLFKDFNYGFTPKDFILHSREYSYSVEKGSYVKQLFTLHYTSSGVGTLSVQLLLDKEEVKTVEVDLTKNPNCYTLEHNFVAKEHTQNMKIIVTGTSTYTFNGISLEIFGKKIRFFPYDEEIKVYCFNNKIYLTRYQDGVVKYGKFAHDDEIDLENLPETMELCDDDSDGYTFVAYGPLNYPTKFPNGLYEVIYKIGIDNKTRLDVITKTDNLGLSLIGTTKNCGSLMLGGHKQTPYAYSARYGVATRCALQESISNFDYANIAEAGDWIACEPIHRNFMREDEVEGEHTYSQLPTKQISAIALGENGYYYYLNHDTVQKYVKIAKGLSCFAFAKTFYTANVYIFDGKNIQKYFVNITQQTCTFIETITDCDCVYETYNDKIIKHTISTNTWSIETLPYYITES